MGSFARPESVLLAAALFFVVGCEKSRPAPVPGNGAAPAYPTRGYGTGYGPGAIDVKFLDSVESNALSAGGFNELAFVNVEGEPVRLSDLLGKKNLVLVVTRGHTGPICPFCSTQTSRLISNYEKFAERNAEVVVVYPIERQADSKHLDGFLQATRQKLASPQTEIQFPILLDVELKSVEQLGIRKDLSKPATYILDTEGQVRFAYVGSTIADRPSIKALLAQLDAIVAAAGDGGKSEAAEPETAE